MTAILAEPTIEIIEPPDIKAPEPVEPEHELVVLDHTGDSRISWDPRNAEETEAARKHYKRLKDRGFLAYRVDPDGGQGEVLREFDPTARRIMMSPQMAGG